MKYEKYGLALIGIIISLSIFVQSITNSIIVGLVAFGMLFVLFDFRNPIFQNYFNRFIPNKNRATVLSVNNMFISASSIIGSLFFYGWITENFGIRNAYIVSALIIFISAMIYLAIKKK